MSVITSCKNLVAELERCTTFDDNGLQEGKIGMEARATLYWKVPAMHVFAERTERLLMNHKIPSEEVFEVLDDLDHLTDQALYPLVQKANINTKIGFSGNRHVIMGIRDVADDMWRQVAGAIEKDFLESGWLVDAETEDHAKDSILFAAAIGSYRDLYDGKVHQYIPREGIPIVREKMDNVFMKKHLKLSPVPSTLDYRVGRRGLSSEDPFMELLCQYLRTEVLRQVVLALSYLEEDPVDLTGPGLADT